MKIFLSYANSERERIAALVGRLRDGGHEIITANTLEPDPTAVTAAILSSQAIVAVLSPDAPNAYFELGLAFGASLPAIVLAAQDVEIPADVASSPYIRLTGDTRRDATNLLIALNHIQMPRETSKNRGAIREADLMAIASDARLIDRLSPEDFERMVGDLLQARGWQVERSAIRNGAEIDLLISGEDNRIAVVEVKKVRSQGRVSVEAVRDLLSKMAVAGTRAGALISTAGFTSSAVAMASGTGASLLTLSELVSNKSAIIDLLSGERRGEVDIEEHQDRKN
ncbi:MAG TPA: restriction endonuclease [Falsiroseomonas sp.]|jgi:HJR/Mrr/RecB family endonuclease|nr:restriction endonuclease [Falsiroseomonas sp.]